MKRAILICAFLLLAGCQEYSWIAERVGTAAEGVGDPHYWEKRTAMKERQSGLDADRAMLDADRAMLETFLSEKQELEREDAAIVQELKELLAQADAFQQGPEYEFLLTLTDEEIALYKKLRSTEDVPELILVMRRIHEVFSEEKLLRLLDLLDLQDSLSTQRTALLEKSKDYEGRILDYQRRLDVFARSVEAKQQQQQRRDATFEQQQRDAATAQQQREQELYRTNMLHTMRNIESDLGDINRHQQQEH